MKIDGVTIGDMAKSTYDPDKDGKVALAQLVDAVCSETELADAITTHAELPNVHHTKAVMSNFVKEESRSTEAAAGDVSYSGYGFQPNCLIIAASRYNCFASVGLADENLTECCIYQPAVDEWENASVLIFGGTAIDNQSAILKSLDADGFTLTWTKTGSPMGVIYFKVLALKV